MTGDPVLDYALDVAERQAEPEWLRAVYHAMYMNEDAQEAMQGKLYQQYVKTYERTLRQQIAQAGCKPGRVRLSNGFVQATLQSEALRWATSISGTYNKWLLGAIPRALDAYRAAHGGTLHGMNRRTLSSLMRAPIWNYWHGKRVSGGWQHGKIHDVAVTEETRAHVGATMDFAERSKLPEAKVRVLPTDSVCDICRSLVARGAMSVAEARSVLLPAHPKCPHALSIEHGKVVDCSSLWRGL